MKYSGPIYDGPLVNAPLVNAPLSCGEHASERQTFRVSGECGTYIWSIPFMAWVWWPDEPTMAAQIARLAATDEARDAAKMNISLYEERRIHKVHGVALTENGQTFKIECFSETDAGKFMAGLKELMDCHAPEIGDDGLTVDRHW